MAKTIFVAGIPYEMTPAEFEKLFSPFGKVVSVKIPTEPGTGRPRGIGFVEMEVDAEAEAAIAGVHGSVIGGRKIIASEARPKGAPLSAAPGYTGPERRSGKDRRARPPSAPKPWEKKPSFGAKKPWEKKDFGERKPWQDRDPSGEKKPWKKKEFGDKKPWEKKGPGGSGKKWGAGGPGSGRKPGDSYSKPSGFKRKPGGGFRGR